MTHPSIINPKSSFNTITNANIKKYTIGYLRGDGDIDVVATFNGDNTKLTIEQCHRLVFMIHDLVKLGQDYDENDDSELGVFMREDVPDTIDTSGDN